LLTWGLISLRLIDADHSVVPFDSAALLLWLGLNSSTGFTLITDINSALWARWPELI